MEKVLEKTKNLVDVPKKCSNKSGLARLPRE